MFIADATSVYILWMCDVAARATVKFICKSSRRGYNAERCKA